MTMLSDEQLLDRLKDGNSSALEELYRRYAKQLFLYFRHSMSAMNPEDLVHDVFGRVIENAQRFNPKKASFRAWLFRIARNHGIDQLRHQNRIQFLSLERQKTSDRSEGEWNLQELLKDTSQDIEQSLLETSVAQAVHDCIEALQNDEEKQVIMLYYLVGKVYREIGAVIGKSISMVKKRMTAANAKLKRCLEQKGVDSI